MTHRSLTWEAIRHRKNMVFLPLINYVLHRAPNHTWEDIPLQYAAWHKLCDVVGYYTLMDGLHPPVYDTTPMDIPQDSTAKYLNACRHLFTLENVG